MPPFCLDQKREEPGISQRQQVLATPIQKPCELSSSQEQRDQRLCVAYPPIQGTVLDTSTWTWHREGLCLVCRMNKATSGHLWISHKRISRFRRPLSLSLTAIQVTLLQKYVRFQKNRSFYDISTKAGLISETWLLLLAGKALQVCSAS